MSAASCGGGWASRAPARASSEAAARALRSPRRQRWRWPRSWRRRRRDPRTRGEARAVIERAGHAKTDLLATSAGRARRSPRAHLRHALQDPAQAQVVEMREPERQRILAGRVRELVDERLDREEV